MTYTMPEVDRHAQDTATVVIAVGVGDINLALRKPATESEVCFIRNTNLVVA
jgi:type III secretion system FlhB-like substrate exporter